MFVFENTMYNVHDEKDELKRCPKSKNTGGTEISGWQKQDGDVNYISGSTRPASLYIHFNS